MLKFNEIKKDIKNNYNYCTYDCKWYGLDVYMILEDDKLIVNIQDFRTEGELHEMTQVLDIEEFIVLSYKDFIKYINQSWYYGSEDVSYKLD